MKIWIDDLRTPPEGYEWCKSVNETKKIIEKAEEDGAVIEALDFDHDAGFYFADGGDFIRILDWMEETGRDYPCAIHTANPVGYANMVRIINHNGWRLIKGLVR